MSWVLMGPIMGPLMLMEVVVVVMEVLLVVVVVAAGCGVISLYPPNRSGGHVYCCTVIDYMHWHDNDYR